MYLLGIDTCGPSGSVALGRINEAAAEIELEGRTYSATLVSALEEILKGKGIRPSDVGCIVVVHGPGSFTGVRVGLGAAKGLSEGAGVPVIAVSRLEVLAWKAAVESAALDAHRHEVFLRLPDREPREWLAGAENVAQLNAPSKIAVCDDPAADLLQRVWPAVELVRVAPPTASDALAVAAPSIAARHFADVALLDGHSLRRSDAEIFGPTVNRP